jgi:hypothetical protein
MRLACLIALSIAAAGLASADVLFSNLGPGDSYNVGSGPVINEDQWIAADFVASASGSLTSIRIPLSSVSPVDAINLVIQLRGPGPDPNGTLLESWELPPTEITPFPGSSLETLISTLNPTLVGGTSYWLRAQVTPLGENYLWNLNVIGDLFSGAVSTNQGATWVVISTGETAAPAFEVNANVNQAAVPEPSSAALLGMAAAGVLFTIRRRLKQRI